MGTVRLVSLDSGLGRYCRRHGDKNLISVHQTKHTLDNNSSSHLTSYTRTAPVGTRDGKYIQRFGSLALRRLPLAHICFINTGFHD